MITVEELHELFVPETPGRTTIAVRRMVAMRSLRRLRDLRQELDALIKLNVDVARTAKSRAYDQGPTWVDIGSALGMSKQAAQQRYQVKG